MFENLPLFAFIVDTERYAGGFERKLCGYVTGIIGECEVGENEAQHFKKAYPGENPFEEIVAQVPNEEGCCRPVAIWPTPGWFNNGLGGEFRENEEGAEKKAQEHYRQRCIEEARTHYYAKAEHNHNNEKEWQLKALETFTKYPAFLSIAIFLHERPSPRLFAIMKERAAAFCKKGEICLTGFRLLKLSLREEEINMSSS